MSKIMVVEDDASLREIYSIRVTAEGYEVVSAGDGEEALAVAVREKPDLILSDVMMPKISGFDMLDILRSTPETANIKVVMMTALSADDQRQRGERLGADRYLVKSQVGIEDVINAIHDVLGDKAVPAAPSASAAPTAPEAPVTPEAPATPEMPAPTETAAPTMPESPTTESFSEAAVSMPKTPAASVAPVPPADLVTPTETSTQAAPTAPVPPADPVAPIAPVDPTTPTAPVDPAAPVAPIPEATPTTSATDANQQDIPTPQVANDTPSANPAQ